MAPKNQVSPNPGAATEQALEANEARKPMAVPEGGWPADQYTGKGGSYVRDPHTGVRSPAPAGEGE